MAASVGGETFWHRWAQTGLSFHSLTDSLTQTHRLRVWSSPGGFELDENTPWCLFEEPQRWRRGSVARRSRPRLHLHLLKAPPQHRGHATSKSTWFLIRDILLFIQMKVLSMQDRMRGDSGQHRRSRTELSWLLVMRKWVEWRFMSPRVKETKHVTLAALLSLWGKSTGGSPKQLQQQVWVQNSAGK